MFKINKGLFGLYNYGDTKLEVTDEDGYIKACLKGAAQGIIDGAFIVGGLAIITANVLLLTAKNSD